MSGDRQTLAAKPAQGMGRAALGWLRGVVRYPLIVGVSLVFFVIWLGGAGLLGRQRRRRVRLRRWVLRWWGRSLLAVLGVRVERSGEPPRPPFVLVANHMSYLDIPLLASGAGGVFVAKHEIGGWKLIGPVVRSAGTIFVDRGRRRDIPRVLARIEEVLREGDGVILFPEGTSTPGDEVAPFRPSLLEAPARGRLPVSCAALSYRTGAGEPPARTTVCWWGDMTLLDHVWRLTHLRRIDARLAFGRRTSAAADRKALAADLERQVRELFVPAGREP